MCYLAGCVEELPGRLLPSDRNLDHRAARHADARHRIEVDPAEAALPRTAIGGRHGVDAGEHVQPLQLRGQKERERERVGKEGLDGKKGGRATGGQTWAPRRADRYASHLLRVPGSGGSVTSGQRAPHDNMVGLFKELDLFAQLVKNNWFFWLPRSFCFLI